MKMNKTILASVIALGMVSVSGSAMADTVQGQSGSITFTGSVTSATCDTQVTVNGAVTDAVALGAVQQNGNGTPVEFSFQAKNPTTCAAVTASQVAWSGTMNENGFTNALTANAATDAYMYLYTDDAGADVKQVTKDHNVVTYSSLGDMEAMKFKAALHGGQTAGAFQTVASYSIQYK